MSSGSGTRSDLGLDLGSPQQLLKSHTPTGLMGNVVLVTIAESLIVTTS